MKKMLNKKTLIAILAALVLIVILFIIFFNKNDDNSGQIVGNESNQIKEKFLKDLPDLERQVLENPNDAQAAMKLGVAKYATGDVEGAREAYEQTININKEDSVAHNNLGNVYRDMGNYDKAIEEYLKAIEIEKKLTTPYLNLGSIYQYILSKPEKAIGIYKQGIEANPDYVDLYNLLAGVYEKQGDLDNAKKYYEESLSIKADNPAAQNGLKRIAQ